MSITTEVTVCNNALAFLGKNPIASLDDLSAEGKQCKAHYSLARDFVLSLHNWNFTIKRQILAEMTTPPTDWTFVYKYPSDCIKAIKIITSDRLSTTKIPFEVAVDADDVKVIYCDLEAAELLFTTRGDIPANFSPAFSEALSLWLAYKMAMPLTKERSLASAALEGHNQSLSRARIIDANEGTQDVPADSAIVRARR